MFHIGFPLVQSFSSPCLVLTVQTLLISLWVLLPWQLCVLVCVPFVVNTCLLFLFFRRSKYKLFVSAVVFCPIKCDVIELGPSVFSSKQLMKNEVCLTECSAALYFNELDTYLSILSD